MSYVPRRTSTPIALCVIFRVAVIFDLDCLSAVPRHHRPRLRGCPHIGKARPSRQTSGSLPGLRLCMVMHVGNSGGSRAWHGLLGRRPDWESAHPGQRVSAKDGSPRNAARYPWPMGRRGEAAAMDRLRVATGSFAEPARLETLHVGEQNEVRGPTEAPVICVAWMAPSQLRVRGG